MGRLVVFGIGWLQARAESAVMDVKTALGTLEQVAVDQVAEALRTAGFLVVVRPRVPRRRILEAAWCLGVQDGARGPQEGRSRLINLSEEDLRTFAETLRWEEVLTWVDEVFLPEYLAALSEEKAGGLLAELAAMTPDGDPGIRIESMAPQAVTRSSRLGPRRVVNAS